MPPPHLIRPGFGYHIIRPGWDSEIEKYLAVRGFNKELLVYLVPYVTGKIKKYLVYRMDNHNGEYRNFNHFKKGFSEDFDKWSAKGVAP